MSDGNGATGAPATVAVKPRGERGPRHGTAGGYVAWTVLMIVLTIVAFLAVGYGLLPVPWLIGLLLVLAAVQVAAQLVFFMHLNVSRSWYAMAFACGLGFAVVFVVGVMYLAWAY